MMKNSLIILLLSTGLFACNQSSKKQTPADTTQQTVDTGKVKQPILDDSIAKSPATTDTTKTVSADRLISPGKGIGQILLNEDVENVSQLLGRPDSADAAMGSSLMVWYAKHNSSGYKTSVFSHRNMGGKDEIISRIQKILITSPEFKTADGIGVGATSDEIKKSYGLKPTGDYKNKDGKVQVYTDMDKGISFEIDASNKCVGVVVHKAHDTVSAYLNMH
jgi:hypothetical protein